MVNGMKSQCALMMVLWSDSGPTCCQAAKHLPRLVYTSVHNTEAKGSQLMLFENYLNG